MPTAATALKRGQLTPAHIEAEGGEGSYSRPKTVKTTLLRRTFSAKLLTVRRWGRELSGAGVRGSGDGRRRVWKSEVRGRVLAGRAREMVERPAQGRRDRCASLESMAGWNRMVLRG